MAINFGKKRRETFGNPFCMVGLLLVLTALTACGPQAPDWVGGEGTQYPSADYLTAVGSASEAEGAGRRAGDSVLEHLAAVIAAAEGTRPDDWPAGMREEFQERIEIANIWRNEEKGRTFAMAVLERQATADVLQRHLQVLDQRLTESLRTAESADDGFSRLERYREALAALKQRRKWASALRAVRPGSAVSDAPADEGRLQEEITASVRRLTFGVQTPKEEDSTLEAGLVRGLAQYGMRLAPDWDRDLLVRAHLQRLDCARAGTDYRCTAEASVDVLDRGGNVLATVVQAMQERSATQAGARGRTLEKLGGGIAREIVRRFSESEY